MSFRHKIHIYRSFCHLTHQTKKNLFIVMPMFISNIFTTEFLKISANIMERQAENCKENNNSTTCSNATDSSPSLCSNVVSAYLSSFSQKLFKLTDASITDYRRYYILSDPLRFFFCSHFN